MIAMPYSFFHSRRQVRLRSASDARGQIYSVFFSGNIFQKWDHFKRKICKKRKTGGDMKQNFQKICSGMACRIRKQCRIDAHFSQGLFPPFFQRKIKNNIFGKRTGQPDILHHFCFNLIGPPAGTTQCNDV